MKLFVIGNGGREHALIWKLLESKNVSEIYCTIGNAGINKIAKAVDIKPDDITSLKKFTLENKIDFTIVGPEIPLSLGIVDEFTAEGMKIFGPTGNAARLETSKSFAKDFMKRNHIPTASYRSFTSNNPEDAYDYLKSIKYPVVLKADGLAAGKGVIICEDYLKAKNTLDELFQKRIFGEAGEKVVTEQFLTGAEMSIFAISDGSDYVILPSAQDHKKIFDGEKGKNTGGMGSYAPAEKILDELLLDKIKKKIIEPTLKNMKSEGNEYKGCLYCGLMIDDNKEPYVIEFNARFGDPETQVILPLIKSDFLSLLLASANGDISSYQLETFNHYCCCVVLASKGYPDSYETNKVISGLDEADKDCIVFHAGTKFNNKKEIVSSGGRVLNVVGISSKDLPSAINSAYRNAARINFENKYYRTDIGKKGI